MATNVWWEAVSPSFSLYLLFSSLLYSLISSSLILSRFNSKQLWAEKEGLMIEEYANFMKLGLRVLPIPGGYVCSSFPLLLFSSSFSIYLIYPCKYLCLFFKDLLMKHVYTKVFGIRLPRFMSPQANATTIGTSEVPHPLPPPSPLLPLPSLSLSFSPHLLFIYFQGWKFDVKVTAPLVGLLVRYQGDITTIH